jgi:hypothetical protein
MVLRLVALSQSKCGDDRFNPHDEPPQRRRENDALTAG